MTYICGLCVRNAGLNNDDKDPWRILSREHEDEEIK